MSKSKISSINNALNGELLVTMLDYLVSARENWENGTLRSSNDELFILLDRCTVILIEVQADRSLVLKVGKLLVKRGLKDRANTSLATKIVRIVFGDCGKRAFTYAKIISIAAADKRENETMRTFVSNRGGIDDMTRGGTKAKSGVEKQENIEFAVTKLTLTKPIIPEFDMIDALRPHAESAHSFSLAVIRRDANGKGNIVFGINNKALVNSALTLAAKDLRPEADLKAENDNKKARMNRRQSLVSKL